MNSDMKNTINELIRKLTRELNKHRALGNTAQQKAEIAMKQIGSGTAPFLEEMRYHDEQMGYFKNLIACCLIARDTKDISEFDNRVK